MTLRKALQLREPACVRKATTRCESPEERPPAVLIQKEEEEEGGKGSRAVSVCEGSECGSLPLQLSDGGEVDGVEKADGKVSFTTQTVAGGSRAGETRLCSACWLVETAKKNDDEEETLGQSLHMIILRSLEM